MTPLIRYILVTFALALGACGTNDLSSPNGAENGQATQPTATLTAELQLGSRGDDVRALHASLTQLGYFPNAELAQRRPTWRPVVPQAPAEPATYDERSQEAVSAFQRSFGLPVSGVVDVATWELLQTPGCGVPESAPVDPSEKFALSSKRWPFYPTIHWTLRNNAAFPIPAGLDPTAARAAVVTALAKWAAESTITFHEEPDDGSLPLGTILIGFVGTLSGGPPDALGTVVAATDLPNPTGVTWLQLNNKVSWSTAAATASDKMDLHTLLLHELGHALGIDHSGYTTAAMYGKVKYGKQRRDLITDDKVAVSQLYDTFKQLPGAAQDISINGALWIVGTATAPGGYQIKKWNGSSFTVASGNKGGVRVAADPHGGAWIVDQSGNTWFHGATVGSGSWTQVSGCAKDLGISGQLVECSGPGCTPTVYYLVWKTDCSGDASGNGNIYRLWVRAGVTPNGNNWVQDVGSAGVRIAVEREGIPWVVTAFGDIYRRTTADPSNGSYQFFGYDGYDVGVGPGPYAWMSGGNWTGSGYEIYVWNQQPADSSSKPAAPKKNEWTLFDINATEVSADSNGNLYMLSADQTIWTVER